MIKRSVFDRICITYKSTKKWRRGIVMSNSLRRIILFPVFTVVVMLLASCSGTEKLTGPEVKTSIGTLTITKAEIVETLDFGGQQAAPGYQILLVRLKSTKAISEDQKDMIMGASEGVYVVGNDGSETERFMGGWESDPDLFTVGFTPPDSASQFTLHWPGNDSIELEMHR